MPALKRACQKLVYVKILAKKNVSKVSSKFPINGV